MESELCVDVAMHLGPEYLILMGEDLDLLNLGGMLQFDKDLLRICWEPAEDLGVILASFKFRVCSRTLSTPNP